MIKPGNAVLDSVESGDDFPGQSFLFSIPLTGLTIELIIRTYNSLNVVATYNLSNNLVIDADNNKRLKIKVHKVTLDPGEYICKLKLNPGGVRATYMVLKWTILGNG